MTRHSRDVRYRLYLSFIVGGATLTALSIVGLQKALVPTAQQDVKGFQATSRAYGIPDRYCLQALLPGGVKLVDSPAIVKSFGSQIVQQRAWSEGLGKQDSPQKRDVLVESCVVVDSPTLKAGTRVSLVSDAVTGLPARPLTSGKTYFALCMNPVEGQLPQPTRLDPATNLRETAMLTSTSPNELALLDIYPTKANHLAKGPDPDSEYVQNMLSSMAAVRGADRERLDRNFAWFGQKPYFHEGDRNWSVTSDRQARNKFSDIVMNVARTEGDPQMRMKYFRTLMKWNIVGSTYQFGTAVMDAANNPTACSDPYDLPNVSIESPGPFAEDEHFDFFRAKSLAFTAKNKRIREFLLCFYTGRLVEGELPKYVALLPSAPHHVQDALLETLRQSTNDLDKRLKLGHVSGRSEKQIVNRQELISFWQRRVAKSQIGFSGLNKK